jgi:uncharacterized protein YgiM (DUF1202 family)
MTDHRLTNLSTNEQQTFSNTPAGLRPLHILPVPYIPLDLTPGQSFNHACAAACGAELVQAYKPNDPTTVSGVQTEMEAANINELTQDRLRVVMDAHGVPIRRETSLSLFDLFTRLQANKPLILLLSFSMLSIPGLPAVSEAEDTRFVVLIGMDNRQACIHDPAALAGSGAALCLPLASFENALHGATAGGVISTSDLYSSLTPVYGLHNTGLEGYSVRTIKKVNIRSGPALSYGDIGDVPAGVVKTIYEESSDHIYGKIAPGQWINLSEEYVVTSLTNIGSTSQPSGGLNPPSINIPGSHPEDTPNHPPVNIPASQPDALYRVHIIKGVNIRSRPSMSSSDVGNLPTGTECDILEENANKTYGKITTNKWIILTPTYVKRLTNPVPTNPPTNSTPNEASNLPPVNNPASQPGVLYRVRIINNVNIRSGPSMNSSGVGNLPAGAERDILAENADKTFGKIAADRWITLSATYVKKI